MNWEHVVEIQQVVNGYFRALDEKDLDAAHLRRILTDDAKKQTCEEWRAVRDEFRNVLLGTA